MGVAVVSGNNTEAIIAPEWYTKISFHLPFIHRKIITWQTSKTNQQNNPAKQGIEVSMRKHSTSSHVITTIFALMLLFGINNSTFADGEESIDKADIDDAVFGLWASEGSIFRTWYEDGTVKGEILALKDPVYTRAESEAKAGQIRLDDKNPDKTLKTRTILGINIFSNYEFKNGQWQGQIYDPESGNTYQSHMKFKSGQLEIRGYVGMPMFGRTARFKPATGCIPEHEVMLARIEPVDLAARDIDISCD